MSKKAILFDLDGTLTDSGAGIINCAILALEHFGLPVPSRKELGVFVGPPLNKSFMEFGVKEDQVDEAIRVFRSRYLTKGKFENFPYAGIPDMLANLKALGHDLYVATSKPEDTALEIMDHFDLSKYFTRICGATMDEARNSKDKVIAYLLDSCGRGENIVMVGDTVYDVVGAKAHNIPTIGVAWGYGNVEDMEKAGAQAIAYEVPQLFDLLK